MFTLTCLICDLDRLFSLAESGAGEEEYSSYMQKHWTCKKCGDTLIVTVADRLQHEQQCRQAHQQQDGTCCKLATTAAVASLSYILATLYEIKAIICSAGVSTDMLVLVGCRYRSRRGGTEIEDTHKALQV